MITLPAALYRTWPLVYDVSTRDPADQFSSAPGFVADAVGANLAGIVWLDASWGWMLALALVVGAAIRLARAPRDSGRLLAALTMVVLYFGLTALLRPWSNPPASRYLTPEPCSSYSWRSRSFGE